MTTEPPVCCPHCGHETPPSDTNGDYYQGPPKAEARFFLARAVWQLHRARQALEKLDSRVLAYELSQAILKVDEVAVLALELTPRKH